MRFKINTCPDDMCDLGDIEVVTADEYDRLVAERDALAAQLEGVEEEMFKLVCVICGTHTATRVDGEWRHQRKTGSGNSINGYCFATPIRERQYQRRQRAEVKNG